DSIADFYLTAFPGGQIGPNIRRFPAMAKGMEALANGEVMAAMGPLAQLQFGARDELAVHQPPLPNFGLSSWTVGIAVHQSHRDLAYALDDAIVAALQDGRMAAAFAAYGLTFTPPDR
ncbi:MAG: amino acid ABC transporter substrate-binding protein, partial [Paracoccaceae bacterium]